MKIGYLSAFILSQAVSLVSFGRDPKRSSAAEQTFHGQFSWASPSNFHESNSGTHGFAFSSLDSWGGCCVWPSLARNALEPCELAFRVAIDCLSAS